MFLGTILYRSTSVIWRNQHCATATSHRLLPYPHMSIQQTSASSFHSQSTPQSSFQLRLYGICSASHSFFLLGDKLWHLAWLTDDVEELGQVPCGREGITRSFTSLHVCSTREKDQCVSALPCKYKYKYNRSNVSLCQKQETNVHILQWTYCSGHTSTPTHQEFLPDVLHLRSLNHMSYVIPTLEGVLHTT